MRYTCPICGKPIPSNTTEPDGTVHINAPFFPFCSQRCRLVDLGAWLDGRYSIPAESVQQQDDSEAVSDSGQTFPSEQMEQ